ncbi:hypothetical protein VNO77_04065 [Canavalia gladiata]|uniref:Uncharacterized protein n=1 Tax=Canavalia gladiata TaxID=3824 RepID=A0AAN9R8Q5_CANGL
MVLMNPQISSKLFPNLWWARAYFPNPTFIATELEDKILNLDNECGPPELPEEYMMTKGLESEQVEVWTRFFNKLIMLGKPMLQNLLATLVNSHQPSLISTMQLSTLSSSSSRKAPSLSTRRAPLFSETTVVVYVVVVVYTGM